MAISPQAAFASWSPSAASDAVSKALPSMTAGLPSIPSLTQSSSADGRVNAAFDNSGFTVVQRGAASTGTGAGNAVPSWLLPALVVLGLLIVRKGRAS